MAHRREVGIAACGIVIGAMLGAGSILAGYNVTASVRRADAQFIAYRQGFILEDQFRRRSISEQDRRTRPQADVVDFDGEERGASDVQEETVVDREACVQKVRIAEEIRSFVIPLIPGRPIDQLVRSSMQDAFDAYIAGCLPYYEEQMSDQSGGDAVVGVKVQPEKIFEDDVRFCYRYSGSRRSRCIVEQRENKNRYQDHR